MATDESKAGWGALAKGAIGAAVLGIAGFVGTVFTNVLSAPKDTVAYDLVQSLTGSLKGEPEPQAQPGPPALALDRPAPEPERAAAPAAAPETKLAAADPVAAIPSPPTQPTKSAPPAAAAPAPASPTPAASAPPPAGEAPVGSMLDRVRQTGDAIEKTRARTAALADARVLTLVDRAETPLCGKTWRVEVTSVAKGRGEVALRRAGDGAAPVTLSVGAPQNVAADCRVELLLAYEDLTARRAQLRETQAR